VAISTVTSDRYKTLDPKRHSRKYATLVAEIAKQEHVRLTDLFDVWPQGKGSDGKTLVRISDREYHYADIDNIGAGEYRTSIMRGWQLPQRAKHFVEPMEAYVGSIWSSVSKWCLIGKTPLPNTVVTNGCHRLRLKPGKEEQLLDACVFFCSEAYTTQMRALARGSDGLAEIHEEDLQFVLVPLIKDQGVRAKLQPFVDGLIAGQSTLKGTVTDLLFQQDLKLPIPAARPHHSVLV
jgi:type I restriction enzyme M protein